MGQKINPKIFRTGVNRSWDSKWFSSGKDYIKKFSQDIKIRKYLTEELRESGIDKVEIERSSNKISINIFTAKPGLVIGRGGTGVDDLKKKVHKKFLSRPNETRLGDIKLNITQVDRPNLSAQILLQSVILDLEKRMPFRKVMKQTISKAERAGALGVRIVVGGRLNGAEIARSEMLTSGKVPLHTLRADIDYSRGAARTTYGAIGVKVWVYRGEVFNKNKEEIKGEIIGEKK
ncbi:MAG: 30S ribosomal protein S3 [Candidatus Falkowbacteria bacterium]